MSLQRCQKEARDTRGSAPLSQSGWDAATLDTPGLTQAGHLASVSLRAQDTLSNGQAVSRGGRGLFPETRTFPKGDRTAPRVASRLISSPGVS